MVPATGILYLAADKTLLVDPQPPITAALAPRTEASGPWARRAPNSMTGRPAAARLIRRDLVAIKDWWLIRLRTKVSSN